MRGTGFHSIVDPPWTGMPPVLCTGDMALLMGGPKQGLQPCSERACQPRMDVRKPPDVKKKRHRGLLKPRIPSPAEVARAGAFPIESFLSDYSEENEVLAGNYHANRQRTETRKRTGNAEGWGGPSSSTRAGSASASRFPNERELVINMLHIHKAIRVHFWLKVSFNKPRKYS